MRPISFRWLRALRTLELVHGARFAAGSGSTVDLESGSTFRMGGVPVTADAADLNKLAAVSATEAQINSVFYSPGAPAYAVLRIADNVADEETVSIGADVYEFDRAADGVVNAGAIAVSGHADNTPANATDALIAAINASGTEAVTAVDISDNQVLIVADAVGVNTMALAETMAGVNNEWDTAALRGGAAAAIKRQLTITRVPNATEVALGCVLIPLDFTPATAIVQVRETATGTPVAWDGNVLLRTAEQRVDLINAGSTDFAATDTITVMISE